MQDDLKEIRKEFDERIKAHGVRVAQIEALFRENISRIDNQVLKMYENIDSLKSSMAVMHKFVDEQRNKISSFGSEFSSFKESCVKSNAIAEKDIKFLQSDVYKFSEKQSKLEKEFQKLSTILEKITEQILALDKLHISFHAHKSEKDIQIQDLDKKIDRLPSQIDFLAQIIKELQAKIILCEELSKRLSMQANDSEKACKHEHSLIREDLTRSIKLLQNQIDSELADIFIPDVSHFVREEALEKMKHEIAVSSIEAKNAYTKATNVEMQQAISSKKLENVQLKINQFELKNQ